MLSKDTAIKREAFAFHPSVDHNGNTPPIYAVAVLRSMPSNYDRRGHGTSIASIEPLCFFLLYAVGADSLRPVNFQIDELVYDGLRDTALQPN